MKRAAFAAVVATFIVLGGVGWFIHEPFAELNAMIANARPKPAMIRDAVIAAEVRPDGRGATITHQLVKYANSTRRRGISHQLQSLLVNLAVGARFTDEQILSAYLEHVYLGPDTYGVDQASRSYFRKHVSELTAAESALLAGLIRSPTLYSPSRAPDRALKRRNDVLRAMQERGFISASTFGTAAREPLRGRG